MNIQPLSPVYIKTKTLLFRSLLRWTRIRCYENQRKEVHPHSLGMKPIHHQQGKTRMDGIPLYAELYRKITGFLKNAIKNNIFWLAILRAVRKSPIPSALDSLRLTRLQTNFLRMTFRFLPILMRMHFPDGNPVGFSLQRVNSVQFQ